MGRVKFGVIFRLNATIILLFTHTEGTRRLRCSCTFGTDGTHKLRCSCTLVPAVHGAPWYRPPPRTSGTGTGALRLPARWYTVRTRTVCAVDRKVRLTYYQHHGRKLARAAVYGSARMIDQIANDVHARAARLPLNADGAPPPPVTLGDFTAAARPARRRRGPASRQRGRLSSSGVAAAQGLATPSRWAPSGMMRIGEETCARSSTRGSTRTRCAPATCGCHWGSSWTRRRAC